MLMGKLLEKILISVRFIHYVTVLVKWPPGNPDIGHICSQITLSTRTLLSSRFAFHS